jgi:uncharacterized protein YaiE (UPF0345 family)
MDYQDAVRLDNFIVKPFGVELRHGYILHQNTFEFRINTIIPYQARVPADDRLFGVTYEGIYDITSRQDNAVKPTPDVTFATQTLDVTDLWSWIPFSNLGENFVCAVSDLNGYFTYDATGGWISRNAGMSGPVGFDPLDLDYIMSWKRRLWFVPQSGTKAYYLPVNQVVGVVEEFDFGPYMRQGGSIKQLVSWTRDGGDGIDDFLIVLGSQGDVIVYQGTDPANADTFAMVGIWDLGSLPLGRRLAIKSGGDVKVLCEVGLIDLSTLFQGAINLASKDSLGYPIQTAISSVVNRTLNTGQWEVHYFSPEELFVVKEPITVLLTESKMWAANVHSRAWGNLNDLPQQTLGMFQDQLYGSDSVGNVYQLLTGNVDNLDFEGFSSEITGRIQTGFYNFGTAKLKKFHVIQPTFQSLVAPALQVQMYTEFNFDALSGSPGFGAPTQGAQWDIDKWDIAVWAGLANTFQVWAGVQGIGFFGSLAMNVRGVGGTIFTHWSLAFEEGGFV